MKKGFWIKNIISGLILVLVLLCLPDSTEVSAAEGIKGKILAQTGIYVRKGPGTEYDNITLDGNKIMLTNSMQVTVLGAVNDWYHIKAKISNTDIEGYSKSGNAGVTWIEVEGTPAVESYVPAVVTASQLNVRKGPGTSYETAVSKPLVYETEVTVTGVTSGWYRVIVNDNGKTVFGYCSATYIKLLGELASEEENGVTEPSSDAGTASDDGKKNSKDDKTGDSKTDEKTADDISGKKDVTDDTEFNPFDLSQEVREGYVLDSMTFPAKIAVAGKVATGNENGSLNIRELHISDAEVVTVLKEGSPVTVINAFIVSTENEEGKTVNDRWYEIVAVKDGECYTGYCLGKYITLDKSAPIEVTLKYDKQILKKGAAQSSDTILDADGNEVVLPKGQSAVIIGEKVNSSNVKWCKLQVEADGVVYKGYVKENRVLFKSTTKNYILGYYRAEEGNGKAEAEPAPDPFTVFTFDEANAHIKNAPALPVHSAAGWTNAAVFDEEKNPVLLHNGDSIQLIDVVPVGEIIWCYIRFFYNGKEYNGYVTSDHIEADSSLGLMSNDEAAEKVELSFEEQLAAQGFPKSYIEKLSVLHELYPLWEFKAFMTGLDWETVIEKENIVGENLLPNKYGVEWKSLDAGAYSWKTDTFIPYDGSTWVTVSEAGLRYYMDPRNFLDANTIFQFEVLNFNPTYQTEESVNKVFKNTAFCNSSYIHTDALGVERELTYAQTVMMAAEYAGVSPLHLASRIKQEVTLGTTSVSNSVTGTVEGFENLYNYYNIGANNSTVAGGAIRNGLTFAKKGSSSATLNTSCLIPWSNPFKSILGGAFYIGNNYINRGQNTIYLQKFNVTDINAFNHQYMGNVEAPYSEGKRMLSSYEEPESLAIVFSIPVFENMPETASPYPEKQLNPNNWLKTLKVYDIDGNKLSITPSFAIESDTEYSLIVASDIEYLKIKTTTVSSLATVTSKSTFYPEPGVNKFKIKVKAENGDVRTYILNVIREVPEQTGEDTVPEEGQGDTPAESTPTEDGGEKPAASEDNDKQTIDENSSDKTADSNDSKTAGTDGGEASGDDKTVIPDENVQPEADSNTSADDNTDNKDEIPPENLPVAEEPKDSVDSTDNSKDKKPGKVVIYYDE